MADNGSRARTCAREHSRSMTVLSITSLVKSFAAGNVACRANVSVLRSLDFALWPGEIVAVEGAVGSGKSTLLRCAAGLLRPDSGWLSWFGRRALQREHLAYVSARSADPSNVPGETGRDAGAMYSQLEQAARGHRRLLLVDDLATLGALEQRLTLSLLERLASRGASVLLAADVQIVGHPCITRVVTLADGVLVQRRKRSAARIAASSPASRARASARSTYGRSLRSPQ